jgi:hypothetical protein
MESMLQIPQPGFINFAEAKDFIEHDVQVDKSTLISRCAGKVSYEFLQMLKIMQFHSIGKDHNGNLFLL